MRLRNYLIVFMVLGLAMSSCKKDDEADTLTAPVRDRGEQYLVDLDSIEEYLSTHFYNYEEFEANPNTTSFQIEIDTIADENSDKTPLIDQVTFKTVSDAEGVDYKLYYLKVREGLGEQPKFADSAFVDYKGTLLNNTTFDSSPNPVWFDLISVVQGFREIAHEFKGASSFTENPDGTFAYNDFGIGAMFIPSGLAYFNEPPFGVFLYSPLVFTFNMYEANESDHDFDHVPSYFEDLNLDGNFTLAEDDTDEDNLGNFLDPDDDGDGIFTRNELMSETYIVDTNMGEMEPTYQEYEFVYSREESDGIITIKTSTLVDSDNNGVWDYLQADITIDYSEE